jgi:predicted nucleic acid-binding protein
MRDALVIADSSCLILLAKIDELEILRSIYKRIFITKEIAGEFGSDLPDWIEVREVENKTLQSLFEDILDLGEASALTLALETQDCTVILDDLKARKTAAKLNIKVTGTIGVIVRARKEHKIPSVKSVFDKILATDFRISDRILTEAIKEAGEQP